MKKGQKLEIDIDKLAFGGKGLARVNNRVVFVEGGIPGDTATVKVRKVKRNYIEAQIVHLNKASRLKHPAPCEHFEYCGGCKWQNLDYQNQIDFKRQQVEESLKQIGEIEPETLHPTIPSPLIFGYRNKMEFSFTDRKWLPPDELQNPDIKKDAALGLHVPGSFDRVMHIEKCWLQDNTMNRILNFSQRYLLNSGIPIYHLKTHEGQLRFLVIRKSFFDNNYMVNVVTQEPARNQLKEFVNELIQKFPQVVSVVNTINRRAAQIAYGEEEYNLFGHNSIREKIGNFEFKISANSFFQTNPLQAENLYRTVLDYISDENNYIWDLFSGTGTISLFLSNKASKVTGFELIESSVLDAEKNCRLNGVQNCKFISGDIRDNIKNGSDSPDVIVCDPPRAGMHPDVVEAIRDVKPKEIVYVSCNPTTMARDVKTLSQDYHLKEVRPVDMFPHTYHIESVAKLVRR